MRERIWRCALVALVVASLATGTAGAEMGDGLVERPEGKPGDLTIAPKTVTIEDGTEVEVEAGVLLVPENRQRVDGPALSIPFYRLRSTSDDPASPIFLLAGGPGSSWIDRFENDENFKEVQRYRGIADVVLFDQRGGGHSLPALSCDERQRLPADAPLDSAKVASALREMSARCRARWQAAGVDLSAYNTRENVADVLALRAALGYERMSLVGGSYGSHLALALMREAAAAIDRVLLYGIEGLDQTWDDPAGRLAAYERIAGAAEVSEILGSSIPDGGLLDALRAVVERLEKHPETVWVGEGDQRTSVVVDAFVVRKLAGHQAARRSRPNAWPELILDLYEGDYALIARGALALRGLRLDDPMHYMMDCASGISPARASRYREDSARELLGDINFEYEHLCDAWDAPDLGSAFRAPVVSDIPTLIVHGTWDVSTPIENAREVVATLRNGQLIEVIGGNHGALYNLYRHWPPMHARVGAFFRGEPVRFPSSVTLPPVTFAPR